jgi:tRNA (guanine10-N2)-dimethyltransferase
MKQFFWLLQSDLALATAEVLALANPSQATRFGSILLIDADEKPYHERLALSHSVHEFLFACHVTELEGKMQAFDWQKHYQTNFKLDIHAPIPPQKLAGIIWRKLKHPNVNLEKPVTHYELFFNGTFVIAGRRIATIYPKPFFERRPHLRPAKHPSGMQPRLARALVNLTGAWKGTIIDPFCGAGGILIESAYAGLHAIGSDNDPDMIAKAKENFATYQLRAKLTLADATKLTKSLDYVVTDFPYGRNTKKQDLNKLYLAFLLKLKKLLQKRAVIVFPHFVNHLTLIRKAKLTIVGEFTNYVHHSLTRKIVVVEP